MKLRNQKIGKNIFQPALCDSASLKKKLCARLCKSKADNLHASERMFSQQGSTCRGYTCLNFNKSWKSIGEKMSESSEIWLINSAKIEYDENLLIKSLITLSCNDICPYSVFGAWLAHLNGVDIVSFWWPHERSVAQSPPFFIGFTVLNSNNLSW